MSIVCCFFILFRLSFITQVYPFEFLGPSKAWADSDKSKIENAENINYHFGAGTNALDNGKLIDIDKENKEVIKFILNYQEVYQDNPKIFIVPGFMPSNIDKPVKISDLAKYRLNSAAKRLLENPGSVIFVSGGNVNPKGTPFNEAIEMKRHLMKEHKVPEFLIAIDPNAQNTVTNLRNAGRFLLALKLRQAIVVTTLVQNLYISFATASGFDSRSRKLLGYEVGEVTFKSLKEAVFTPSNKVLDKSDSLIDP